MIRALPLLLLSACLNTLPATDAGPDNPPDAGSALLGGPLAFGVTSATEVRVVDGFGLNVGYGFSLADHGLSCGALEALDGGPVPGPYHQVFATVGCTQGCAAPPPGTYGVGTPTDATTRVVHLAVRHSPGDGGPPVDVDAISGSVTLTTANPNHLVGSFDVQVPNFDDGSPTQLTGQFDVPYCR